MIDHGADVDAQNKHWQTPLHICALSSDASSAVHFVHRVANVDTTEEQGQSALHYAVSSIDSSSFSFSRFSFRFSASVETLK